MALQLPLGGITSKQIARVGRFGFFSDVLRYYTIILALWISFGNLGTLVARIRQMELRNTLLK